MIFEAYALCRFRNIIMKTRISFLIVFSVITVQSYAQEAVTIDRYAEKLLEEKIDFVSPKNFTPSTVNINALKDAFFFLLPSRVLLALQSDDQACLAVYTGLFKNILVGDKYFPDTTVTWAQARAILHRSRIARGLRHAYGPDVTPNRYLTVDSGRKARKRFNVDSVYTYTVPINDENLKPYTRGVSITMMRYPVHMAGIYLLLTDEGYRKMNRYISRVNRTIRFRGNPKNYTDIDSKPNLAPIQE